MAGTNDHIVDSLGVAFAKYIQTQQGKHFNRLVEQLASQNNAGISPKDAVVSTAKDIVNQPQGREFLLSLKRMLEEQPGAKSVRTRLAQTRKGF